MNQKQAPPFDLQGHRGCRGLLPENTIPGFIKAMEMGVNTLEMDVVVSADQQLVVSHEPFFNHEIALTPDGQPIAEAEEKNYNLYRMSYEQITRFDCGSKVHPRFPEQQKIKVSKPLLEAVIDSAEAWAQKNGKPLPLYNIETKSTASTDLVYHPAADEFAALLYNLLKKKGILQRATIQSFDIRTLQWVHHHDPATSLALLIEPVDENNITPQDFDFQSKIEGLGFTPAIYSPYYPLVTPELISYARQHHIRVIPWTVNDAEEMQKLKQMGVDGLITDYPNRAKGIR